MLRQNLRFGLRTARKNALVTILAVRCLATGIGLDVMMFSVTDGVLIQPLPDDERRPAGGAPIRNASRMIDRPRF